MKYSSNQSTIYYTAILGTGAVGTALSWCLGQKSSCMQYNSCGIIRELSQHTLINQKGISRSVKASSFDYSKLDCVFVSTKIYVIQEVIEEYIDLIPARSPIVLSCNGYILGILEDLKTKYPSRIFRVSYADLGVSKLEDRVYKINSSSSNFIWGPVSNAQDQDYKQTSFEAFLSGYKDDFTSIEFKYASDCIKHNAIKWILNTCLNSLCVYKKCLTNGEVIKYQKELQQLFEETYELASKIFKAENLESSSIVFDKLNTLIKNTATNQNSMISDILQHRRTENEYLAGLCKIDTSRFQQLFKIYSFIRKIDTNIN